MNLNANTNSVTTKKRTTTGQFDNLFLQELVFSWFFVVGGRCCGPMAMDGIDRLIGWSGGWVVGGGWWVRW